MRIRLQMVLALLERPYRELQARRQWLLEFKQKVEEGYVWCADQEPKLKGLETVQDELLQNLEKKRKEKSRKGIPM